MATAQDFEEVLAYLERLEVAGWRHDKLAATKRVLKREARKLKKEKKRK